MAKKPELFAREATGLVREIGFTLGVIIILSHVIGLGWQARAFQYTGPKPMPTDMLPLGLPAMFWAFLVCGIIVLITGYSAGYVTASMPRSGGGYVTISRVIHPVIGYVAGWLMFLAEAFSYGLIAVAVVWAIGLFFNIALAPAITITIDATVLFLGGVAIVILFTVLGLFGIRLYGRLMWAMFLVPAVITITFFAMWIAGIMNPSLLASGVEKVMGKPPSTFVSLALSPQGGNMAAKMSSFYDAFSYALAGAFWAYMGWYSVTFVAGEVKEANKKLPKVVLMAGLITMIVYMAATALSSICAMRTYETIFGGHQWSFFQAYSWLSYGGDFEEAIRAAGITNFQSAWSTGIASFVAKGLGWDWLCIAIALAGVLWIANDIPPFLLVASRTFFAMSFDRMMPERFSTVSERWHSPTWSLIITGVFGIIGCIAESNVADLGPYFAFASMVGTNIYDAIFLTLFCLSCMLLPLERRDIHERAAVKHSTGTVVTLGFIATVLSAYCLLTFLSFFTDWLFPWPKDLAGWSSAAGFYGFIGIGLLLYAYYAYKNTTKGIDVRTIYLTIPPE